MSWKNRNLPPMKFKLDDKVQFFFKGDELVGTIYIRDFGGSLEHDFHSYDILSEDGCLYKHVPEKDVMNFNMRE